ncbi:MULTISPECIES: Bug family tripartite tricarboxylate transporter substrate binding protein [unclassified Nocardioides]|uniref:Bug family tripartite tricarboxylate transporter substrate binding protein n=1 Tax=unclassified Nocardioides TaxID=2615069 RepID=UPI000703BA22|nr:MULTISPECIES: tripartite tricarboxylate transporter substrate-binding protein [unclassified Nocardioides]KRC46246.1 C4-dicarboxylate ABC transporter substrate-binding protein [Nocardioides sp. Root79]KRC69593.1 C4-dicarboxylate ABC transporter substrate-binding protein [Nocardioides sp. Root240]
MHPRRTRTALVALLAALSLVALTSGCGVTRGSDDPDNRRLRLFIPNSPGGGYDLTGRAAARVMEDDELTGRFEIRNVVGASGTVAMQRLLNEEGSDDLMMVMGLGVVGAVYTNHSDATPLKMTPIARLVEEQEGILVPADSPFRTVNDLVAAWKKDPGGITVGGGSGNGGPDHLFPMQLADTIGVAPTDVNYISYDGGGPLTTALLGEKIDVGMSGLGEFEAQIDEGKLRVLAVSGDERLEGIDAPTLTEAGVDLVFTNWRGVLAPPGISDEQRDYLTGILTEMHDTEEWREALATNGWSDNFATGKEFEDFLVEQDARVADTLKELGFA